MSITHQADEAYDQASAALSALPDVDSHNISGATLASYRAHYEQVRSELLDRYPQLDGPTIGDILGEAAGTAWPTILHHL